MVLTPVNCIWRFPISNPFGPWCRSSFGLFALPWRGPTERGFSYSCNVTPPADPPDRLFCFFNCFCPPTPPFKLSSYPPTLICSHSWHSPRRPGCLLTSFSLAPCPFSGYDSFAPVVCWSLFAGLFRFCFCRPLSLMACLFACGVAVGSQC